MCCSPGCSADQTAELISQLSFSQYTERKPEGIACNGLTKINNTCTKTQTTDNSMPAHSAKWLSREFLHVTKQ